MSFHPTHVPRFDFFDENGLVSGLRRATGGVPAGADLRAVPDGALPRLDPLPARAESAGAGAAADADAVPRRRHDAGRRPRAVRPTLVGRPSSTPGRRLGPSFWFCFCFCRQVRRSGVAGLLDGQRVRAAALSQVRPAHLRLLAGRPGPAGRRRPVGLPQRQRRPDRRVAAEPATHAQRTRGPGRRPGGHRSGTEFFLLEALFSRFGRTFMLFSFLGTRSLTIYRLWVFLLLMALCRIIFSIFSPSCSSIRMALNSVLRR